MLFNANIGQNIPTYSSINTYMALVQGQHSHFNSSTNNINKKKKVKHNVMSSRKIRKRILITIKKKYKNFIDFITILNLTFLI